MQSFPCQSASIEKGFSAKRANLDDEHLRQMAFIRFNGHILACSRPGRGVEPPRVEKPQGAAGSSVDRRVNCVNCVILRKGREVIYAVYVI